MNFKSRFFSFAFAFLVVAYFTSSNSVVIAQTGHILDAVGAVNQSMGGAGTAMPLDVMGAMFRNPASIHGLPSSEMGIGFQIFGPETTLSSSVSPSAFGAGIPGALVSGSTGSDTEPTPIPNFAYVSKSNDSRWAHGVSGFGTGGFGVDFPGSFSNPITSSQPPNGFGFGPVFSNFQFLQITGTVAYQLTEFTSVGIGLNGDWGTLSVSPFSASAPDDANGDGFPSYPSGARGSSAWGLGMQTGVYYENPLTGIHLGVTYKTPQWMQTYKINSQDELGNGRQLEFDLDYPSIVSIGIGYSGIACWRFACDVRYIDYEGTDGFQAAGFDGFGAVTGFGWRNILTTAIGGEYQFSSKLALRAGYTYNENPIADDNTFFNIHAPGIIQHHISSGFSYTTSRNMIVSMALHHGFKNSISGPWIGPSGPIPGTSVTSELSTYSLTVGVNRRF